MWGRRLRDLTVVFLLEEVCHHLGLALAFSNLEHGPDEEADHVVKKPVGCDIEYKSALPFAPACPSDCAAMVIPVGSGALDCECQEATLALDRPRRDLQTLKIERFLPDQLVCPAKRGRCEIVCAYVVAVAAGYRAEAGVELVTHFEGCRNPYIIR
jgi:hypothetical protein